jgi:archaeosine-15-forming tRNA-guanine transglycosylase
MPTINIRDNLRVTDNHKLLELFTPTETIVYSGEVQKINKKKTKQLRKIVITTESIYSIRDAGFFTTLFGKGGLIRRRIDITKIKALVYARLGNEFVINVPEEFDWRIIDVQKDQIIDYI